MTDDPLLLTPGPLTTSPRVKEAMLRDFGSRDPAFTELSARTLSRLRDLAGGTASDHVCVPVQGSGTFAIEAMFASFVPASARVLVLVNGAYGRRMVEICARIGCATTVYEVAETETHDPRIVARRLADDATLAYVAMIHCETTSGLLNPLAEIADVVRSAGRTLLVDSMSGFGALPLDMATQGIGAVAASSNKALQGVPGLAFVVARQDLLDGGRGRARSLVLDLSAQAQALAADGQWRFTPPTHVVAALAEALDELDEEGGPPARLARYRENLRRLSMGMAQLGFTPALDPTLQAPVIASFIEPDADWYGFEGFYTGLRRRGFAIYAGKMRALGTFRVGVIGAVHPEQIDAFLTAVADVVTDMKHKVMI